MKMKTRNKALLLSLCAVLLVAASVMGTLAYLTDTETVKNTFTVGSVAITLDEADVDDSDNDGNTTERDKANGYKLLPGHQYDKDPIIHVASTSEDCYLFVIVKNEIADIESDAEGDKKVAVQMDENGWKEVGKTADGTLYVYVGTTESETNPLAVSANSNIDVFKTFTIDGDKVVNVPDGEIVPDGKIDLSAYDGKTIVVSAYAVQKDGFENNTASEIWNTAFGTPVLQ